MYPSARRSLQAGIGASLKILAKSILRTTAYDAVCKAATQPSQVDHLVKQLSDLRKTSLVLLFALIGLYVNDGRLMAASWTGALILLTHNISSLYDSIDSETFKAHVDAMGPAVFTIVSTTPGFAVTAMLSAELIIRSASPVVGVLQVVLALLPGLLPTIGEALSIFWQSTPPSLPLANVLPSPA